MIGKEYHHLLKGLAFTHGSCFGRNQFMIQRISPSRGGMEQLPWLSCTSRPVSSAGVGTTNEVAWCLSKRSKTAWRILCRCNEETACKMPDICNAILGDTQGGLAFGCKLNCCAKVCNWFANSSSRYGADVLKAVEDPVDNLSRHSSKSFNNLWIVSQNCQQAKPKYSKFGNNYIKG